ncbi:hypothetical protein chiPu_0028730, partial [Chiloscyllium punctatum]|nr:hypothetical protein [Chiloscyllium punctatum]
VPETKGRTFDQISSGFREQVETPGAEKSPMVELGDLKLSGNPGSADSGV